MVQLNNINLTSKYTLKLLYTDFSFENPRVYSMHVYLLYRLSVISIISLVNNACQAFDWLLD